MEMNMTMHARQRMQQRGINREAMDYVLTYGRASRDHHGCRVVWLDKQARKKIRRAEGAGVERKLDKHLNAYAVVDSDGVVVTVGHRYRRIRKC